MMHVRFLEQCLVHHEHLINVITTLFLTQVGPDAVAGDLFPPSAHLCNWSHLGLVRFLRQSCHLTACTAPALGEQARRIRGAPRNKHALPVRAGSCSGFPSGLESWAQGQGSCMAEAVALQVG